MSSIEGHVVGNADCFNTRIANGRQAQPILAENSEIERGSWCQRATNAKAAQSVVLIRAGYGWKWVPRVPKGWISLIIIYFDAIYLAVSGIQSRFDQKGFKIFSCVEQLLVKGCSGKSFDKDLQGVNSMIFTRTSFKTINTSNTLCFSCGKWGNIHRQC